MRKILVLVAVLLLGSGIRPAAADPSFSVEEGKLDAALSCTPFTHPNHEPVLLVHGTFTSGHEQYRWNYELLLADNGFDYCTVTYPDRGLGDQQVSGEYVAHAIIEMSARASGGRVDVVGHSQGAVVPRWAVKWWPSARAAVDDMVLIAGPSHGTAYADRADQSPFSMPEAFWQFDPGSQFLAALNAGDETPGTISYTSLYSETDELVQPASPVPTAGLDWGQEDANTMNLSMQSVCPGRIVDHLTIGTTDRAAQTLVLDALTNGGPADPVRAGLGSLCALPDQYADQRQPGEFADQFADSFGNGFPNFHNTNREPPLAPYAQ